MAYQTKGLAIGAALVEKPDDTHPVFNRPSVERGVLVVALKLKNEGSDIVSLSVRDLSFERSGGERLSVLTRSEAAKRMAGSVRNKFYRFLLFENVYYGYEVYGLPDDIILLPGREVSGYVFFALSRDMADGIRPGSMKLLVTRTAVVERIQYELKVGEPAR